jgi:DNA-binding transcriptional MocR family regulator
VLADAFATAGQSGLISLAVGWPSPQLYPTAELARITASVFEEEGGEALSYLPAEGLWEFRAARGTRPRGRLGRGARRDRRHVGRQAGAQPRGARHTR